MTTNELLAKIDDTQEDMLAGMIQLALFTSSIAVHTGFLSMDAAADGFKSFLYTLGFSEDDVTALIIGWAQDLGMLK